MNELEMLREQIRLLNELVKAKDATIEALKGSQQVIYRYYPYYQYPRHTIYGAIGAGGMTAQGNYQGLTGTVLTSGLASMEQAVTNAKMRVGCAGGVE